MGIVRNIRNLFSRKMDAPNPLEIEKLCRRLEELESENSELRARLGRGVKDGGVNPKNLVWIFGAGRSGSTWLARMMGEFEKHAVWFEPHVGDLFDPINLRTERRKGGKHFILGERYRESWLPLIREFVIDGARIRFPELGRECYLLVKEPSGSAAASWLMEALPESRMILLIRDPRDVVASWKKAYEKGGWVAKRWMQEDSHQRTLSDRQVTNLVRETSRKYMQNVSNAHEAYKTHAGHKVLIHYEELRANTLETVKRIYLALEIPVDEEEVRRIVESHSWENIPEGKKGEGKFHRKATPGGWREDLSPEQIEIVEKVTAPILKEFYPN